MAHPQKGATAMNKPMFFYAGVYADVADAEVDYDAIKALHSADLIGSYDAVVVSHELDGSVKIDKREKPTQHGGWVGLAAGAAIAVAAPGSAPGSPTSRGGSAGATSANWGRRSTRARPP